MCSNGSLKTSNLPSKSKIWLSDPDILADARELLCHQNPVFGEISEKLEGYYTALSKKTQKIPETIVSLDVMNKLIEARDEAKTAVLDFIEKFQYYNPKTDRNTVPASTFRELLVQNTIKKSAHEIFRAIKDSQGDRQMALGKATDAICTGTSAAFLNVFYFRL